MHTQRHEVYEPTQQTLSKWSRRIARGEAVAVPVFTAGKWTFQVVRNNKRTLQFALEF